MLVIAIFAFVTLVPLAYFFLPGPVGSKSLGYSVAGASGGATVLAFEDPQCKRSQQNADEWRCWVEDPSGSGGGTTYRVQVGSWSCWDGTRVGPRRGSETAFPREIHSCVKLGDSFRLLQGALD
jgi:hypothetical protein